MTGDNARTVAELYSEIERLKEALSDAKEETRQQRKRAERSEGERPFRAEIAELFERVAEIEGRLEREDGLRQERNERR